MQVNVSIFKAYDIRGKYPKELSKELASLVGHGFIGFLQKEHKKKILTIVIGRDARHSSPILFQSISQSIQKLGCNVVDVGVVTTPMLYFAVSEFGYDGGVMITASHNPEPYNGIKLTKGKAIPIGEESGLSWIKDHLQDSVAVPKNQGSLSKKNIAQEYIQQNLEFSNTKKGEFQSMTIVLDAGKGTAGPIAEQLLKIIGAKVIRKHSQYILNPLEHKHLQSLIRTVKKNKADFGLALDGDGDRIAFIDERGEVVPGDLITAFVSHIILRKQKAKILYDVRSSNILPEMIKQAGGKPIPFRIGHALIKEKMRKEQILFAGEYSGHYYWGENLYYEVPFFVLLYILKEMKEKEVPLSELIKPFRKYYHSGEINFAIEQKEKVIETLAKKYKHGKIVRLDGLRVNFPDWWFLVRLSNTESLLRLVVEAKTKKLLALRLKELTHVITR